VHPIFQEAASSWASGLPLTVAFLLVLRPTPARHGFLGFRLFLALAMAAAFSPGVSTVMGLLLPGVWLGVLIAEGLLLRPSIPRATAHRYGRPLVLLLDPLLYAVPAWVRPSPCSRSVPPGWRPRFCGSGFVNGGTPLCNCLRLRTCASAQHPWRTGTGWQIEDQAPASCPPGFRPEEPQAPLRNCGWVSPLFSRAS